MSETQDLSKGRCFGYALSTVRDDRRFQERVEKLVADEYESGFKDDYRWGGVFLDLKYTEGVALFARPAGGELLTKTARGDVLIFPHLDRGFRDLRDFADAIGRFRLRGVRVAVPDLGLDTLHHQDVVAIVEKLVAFNREARKRVQQDAIRDNWQQGKATPGRRPPIGFRLQDIEGVKYVVGDAAERALMERMLGWAERGWTPAQIAHQLNHVEKVPNPEQAPWNPVTVGHWVAAEQVIRNYERHARVSMNGKVIPADLRDALKQDVLKEVRMGHIPPPEWQ